ncbi:MAG: hemerythrin domain-containing protein [Planctomycetes bacterium]|nr:hemerythrin domain-containing protein [Planctomycetota bacterium]
MPYRLVSEQMLKEHEVLAQLSDALRTAIRWGQHGDLPRKMSAVHFLLESFQRHLERMLALEERGGCLEMLKQSHPDFQSRADAFRQEHDQFRDTTRRLLQAMSHSPEPTPADVESVFGDLTSLLEKIDSHNQRELDLLQEVILHQQSSEADPRD